MTDGAGLRLDITVLDRMRARVTQAEGYTAEQMGRDFRRVLLGSDEGERVAMVILGWAGFWSQSMVPDRPDMTAYNLGRRQIGIELWNALTAPLPSGTPEQGGGSRTARPTMAPMEEGDHARPDSRPERGF